MNDWSIELNHTYIYICPSPITFPIRVGRCTLQKGVKPNYGTEYYEAPAVRIDIDSSDLQAGRN